MTALPKTECAISFGTDFSVEAIAILKKQPHLLASCPKFAGAAATQKGACHER